MREKITLKAEIRKYKTRNGFAISRGVLHEIETIFVTLSNGEVIGEGECRPYSRYNETPEQTLDLILKTAPNGILNHGSEALQTILPAGAARNAIDCALYDLKAKKRGQDLWDFFTVRKPGLLRTAVTVDLRPPQAMIAHVRNLISQGVQTVKIKCGDNPQSDLERIKLLIENNDNKQARFILDPNEGWNRETYLQLHEHFLPAGVALLEQPFPESADSILTELPRPVPVCADESFHDERDLNRIAQLYDAVNIKLDKTGGLTGAFKAAAAVRNAGLQLMVGCMTAGSRAMAPAALIAVSFHAEYVDLDGPLLLSQDIENGLIYRGDQILLKNSPLSETQIIEMKNKIAPSWRVIDGKKLYLKQRTKNFAESLLLANAIGNLAEEINHHPDLTVTYHACEIAITTHDQDHSLTEKDFILAEKIDRLCNG